jgi:lysophospholipid acyltransferase (LPLAT)-like uncharacterized protein
MDLTSADTDFELARHEKALVATASFLGKWLVRSLRFDFSDPDRFSRLQKENQAVIFATWHAQLLLAMSLAGRFRSTTLVSASRDGEIAIGIGRSLGVRFIRVGERQSTTATMRQLPSILRDGLNVGITPDGPLGPMREVKPGIVFLSQQSGCPIIPVGFRSRWVVGLNTKWERLALPWPFAPVRVSIGDPVLVPSDADRSMKQQLATQIAEQLNRLS